MGLKKYEIITVGSDKRVRALRSWQVGDRYVNIGDVGGIVYDEKTLSQDGLCWLFRGNFNFPGARIGGDSIVDVGETTLSAAGAPNVDILGSSVVVGSKLRFESEKTTADAVVLTAGDFEQGTFASYIKGQKLRRVDSANYIRTKNPIFMGGESLIVKCGIPGFIVTGLVTDADGYVSDDERTIQTVEGGALALPAGQYFSIVITKNPAAATVPADATAAQITFTGTYETKLSIIDSRVEINPATSTGILALRPGGTYAMAPGVKYPDSVIQNSKVSMMVHATANRAITLMAEFINTSAVIDASVVVAPALIGIYKNVKNLAFSGSVTGDTGVGSRGVIQANDCDNFAVSATIFPGLAAAQTANIPFTFQGCNVPDGRFPHDPLINNTYINIDFAKARTDLNKVVSGFYMRSSNVEGMYRLGTGNHILGCLIESYDSVKSFVIPVTRSGYYTTIYKDAYLNGLFDIAGTNVFGNTMKHEASNTQDISGILVNGLFNATTNGGTISGVVANNARAVVSQPFRVSGAGGVSVSSPAGVECNIYLTDATNKILVNTGYVSGTNAPITPALTAVYAYIAVRKADGSDILSLDEVKGVTVTTYNGCKIVNTGETAVSIKGNFRVEDNATLINCSLIGSGYFGGKAVASGLLIEGLAFMSDNASFTKTAGVGVIGNLKMKDNGVVVLGDVIGLGVLDVTENARLQPTNLFLSEADLIMSGNALVTAGLSISGILRLKDNAKVAVSSMTAKGDITVCGSYSQSAQRRWVGKRVIDNENAPEYDNNVKTKYDF